MNSIIVIAISLLISLLSLPLIKKFAVKINLVDKPNARKLHTNLVPLVGGIVIATTVLLMMFFVTNRDIFLQKYLVIFIASYILLIIGVLDDKYDINAKLKLVIQLALAFLVAYNGIRINSFFGILGVYEIEVWLQYLITIVIITGVVNAYNLIDGVDGLVGGLTLLGFVMFLVLALFVGNAILAFISSVFIGAVLAFLKFNLSQNKIFMGDAGSLFIGFLLVSTGIQFLDELYKQPNYNNFLYAFLAIFTFFAIPVFDSIRVYVGRMKYGNSPFKADKTHLHHLLVNSGLTHKNTSFFVVCFCVALCLIGIGLCLFFDITIIFCTIFLMFKLILKVITILSQMNDWKNKLYNIENSY